MSMTYSDVLERLKEERRKRKWSQKDMSRHVHMSQGNYSRIEMGTRRLSFEELKYLCGSGVDVHYIFTGQKCRLVSEEFSIQCSYSQLECRLSVIASVIAYYYTREDANVWKDMYREIRLLQLIVANRGLNDNLFFLIRRSLNYQQQKMAGILGVDIKKLRDLENERCLPDSELVWRLYDLFSVSPAFVLEDNKCLNNQINYLLERLKSLVGSEVWGILKVLQDAI